MTPLPQLATSEWVAWRLDSAVHAHAWDRGEGAFRVGGRWNSRGRRAVYCAIDPACAILEVAVHKGFAALDSVAHVLTSLAISPSADVHRVDPDAVPNPNWLVPAAVGLGQQSFGDKLLAMHDFVIIPSTVSRFSWNVVFDPARAAGHYRQRSQMRFALDPRLPPKG